VGHRAERAERWGEGHNGKTGGSYDARRVKKEQIFSSKYVDY
jgi:hypothetical protein